MYINALDNTKLALNNTESDGSVDSEIDDFVPTEDEDTYHCDRCEFEASSGTGLKIHVTKVHKKKCNTCRKTFESAEELKRHMIAETTIDNVSGDANEDFVVKEYNVGENCLGLFSTLTPRDDSLPNLFLQSLQC